MPNVFWPWQSTNRPIKATKGQNLGFGGHFDPIPKYGMVDDPKYHIHNPYTCSL